MLSFETILTRRFTAYVALCYSTTYAMFDKCGPSYICYIGKIVYAVCDCTDVRCAANRRAMGKAYVGLSYKYEEK